MKKQSQTFLEAVEEVNKAGAEVFHVFFHAYFAWVEPFLDWLSKKIEKY